MADFPSWRYGPNGAADIFHREEDVPEGWYDHPSLVPFAPEENLSEIQHLRAEYKERFGKRPGPSWDEATLREKLA